MGRILCRTGRYAEALPYLDKVPDKARAVPVHWAVLTRAWCLDALGQRQEALQAYRRTLDITPLPSSAATCARIGLQEPYCPLKREPAGALDGLVELTAQGWQVTAEPNGDTAAHAIDRDPLTRWDTGYGQKPGAFFQLDLGRVQRIGRVVLDDDGGGRSVYVNDYPRQYIISVSVDGSTWQQVASGTADPRRYAGASFGPVDARYLRVEQHGQNMPECWSIYDIRVYQAQASA